VTPNNRYAALEESIGYSFKDPTLLETALTHSSVRAFAHESDHLETEAEESKDYERLEFLGDAVLDLAIAELLIKLYPKAREGELSKLRAALVNTGALAEQARGLQLSKFIRLGRAELNSGALDRDSLLADVFEALIGAMYRDGGFEPARKTIAQLFDKVISTVKPRDPKTELQEILHAVGKCAPAYLLECVEGPEHAPSFVSVVKIDEEIVGRGRGATKKASQQEAASQALKYLANSSQAEKKE